MKLLHQNELEQSWVVANTQMNRQRTATGVNSYQQELGLNIIEFLIQKQQRHGTARWLDLCCGEGNALIEVGQYFFNHSFYKNIQLLGIDLVGMFAPLPQKIKNLKLIESSIFDWNSSSAYDLITCVHGLHYLGDKLAALEQIAAWLKTDGFFIGQLDPLHLKIKGQKDSLTVLQKAGFQYNKEQHLLSLRAYQKINFKLNHLGADDSVGANYTGQYAVKSFYE